MENKRVLITGNRDYGLCKAICDLFDTVGGIDYSACSRSTGWQLDKSDEQDRLAQKFIDDDFNVFINNAALWKYQQTLILETFYTKLLEEERTAHIISMGSTADTGVKGRTWRYPTEKKTLKVYNRDLTYMTIGGSNVKTTLLSPGSLTTPSVVKKHPDRKLIDVEYIAEVILWLIQQPDYVNINEISLDPIQSGHFAR